MYHIKNTALKSKQVDLLFINAYNWPHLINNKIYTEGSPIKLIHLLEIGPNYN